MWKYVLFLVAIQTIGRLPLGFGYALAELAGRLAYRLVSGNRRNVISNLRRVMGAEAPAREVKAAARKVFVNVAKYYVDLVRMPHMDLDGFYKRRFRYYGFDEHLLTAVAEGKGVIVLSGHMGNPELAVQGMLPRGVKVFALTEPLQPPRLSRLVDRLRASKGNVFAPVGFASVKQAIKTIRAGGVVALMGDRDIEGPRASLPFFGEEALMPVGPIEVALRTGAPLIPCFTIRTGAANIEAFVEERLELQRTGDMEADARAGALLFLGRLERRLREHPDQWVVLESVWDGAKAGSEPAPVAVGEEA
ncbi:MAG: lysophospholipid acyltransferase family protein [Dehalococcoidia bacterium]|nr:lysophospholipid acyltransferase family protein [Dehalococcoidia bacterium]